MIDKEEDEYCTWEKKKGRYLIPGKVSDLTALRARNKGYLWVKLQGYEFGS